MKPLGLFLCVLLFSGCGCGWRADDCNDWLNTIQLDITLIDAGDFNNWAEAPAARPVVLGTPDAADTPRRVDRGGR